jgi:hypothetical protein
MLNTGGGEASHDGEAADKTEAARYEAGHGQHRVKLVEPGPCAATARREEIGSWCEERALDGALAPSAAGVGAVQGLGQRGTRDERRGGRGGWKASNTALVDSLPEVILLGSLLLGLGGLSSRRLLLLLGLLDLDLLGELLLAGVAVPVVGHAEPDAGGAHARPGPHGRKAKPGGGYIECRGGCHEREEHHTPAHSLLPCMIRRDFDRLSIMN